MTPTVANVLSVYSTATAAEMREGLAWYLDANRFAHYLADTYITTVEQAAGVIAALSPMMGWESNKAQAEKAFAVGTDGLGLRRNCDKAAKIIAGDNPLDILGGDKVRAFYATIVCPTGDIRPVIDRHAFDIAVGEVTNDAARSTLSRKGVYERFADVYRHAAIDVGIGAAQMQAITWVSWRNRK